MTSSGEAMLTPRFSFFHSMQTGFLTRTSLVSVVFRKALRLSGRSRLQHSTGQVGDAFYNGIFDI